MIKKLVYIFIPVLAVLLMSHNVLAISPIINLNDYETFLSESNVKIDCTYSDSSVQTSVWFCYLPTGTTLRTAVTSNKYNFQKNDIINFKLVLKSRDPGLDDWFQVGNPTSAWPFRLIQFDQVVDNNSYVDNQNGTNSVNTVFDVTFLVTSNVDNQAVGFNNITDFISYRANHTNAYDELQVMLGSISGWRKTGSQVNKEQEQATQDAANNSATSGSNSSSNSQTATSSLLSVIASGVGAITSASPTNCKINGNMGNLNIGNIDLCANTVPTFMAIIGSIIAVLVVLPLVIVLFNRFISIIRSFQK